jgi:hypothetical protein
MDYKSELLLRMEWYLKSHVSVDADHVEMGQQEFCNRSAAIGMLLSAKPNAGFFFGMEREQRAIRAPGLKPQCQGTAGLPPAPAGVAQGSHSMSRLLKPRKIPMSGAPVADKTHCISNFSASSRVNVYPTSQIIL